MRKPSLIEIIVGIVKLKHITLLTILLELSYIADVFIFTVVNVLLIAALTFSSIQFFVWSRGMNKKKPTKLI